jgi:hypothetical protein
MTEAPRIWSQSFPGAAVAGRCRRRRCRDNRRECGQDASNYDVLSGSPKGNDNCANRKLFQAPRTSTAASAPQGWIWVESVSPPRGRSPGALCWRRSDCVCYHDLDADWMRINVEVQAAVDPQRSIARELDGRPVALLLTNNENSQH